MKKPNKTVVDMFGNFIHALVFLSVIFGLIVCKHILNIDYKYFNLLSPYVWWLGLISLAVAIFILTNNYRLMYFSSHTYKNLHGTLDGYRKISPIPIVSTVFAWCAAFTLNANFWLGLLLVAIVLLDLVTVALALLPNQSERH